MPKELHPNAKAEIIQYTMHFSNGLIVDDRGCPHVCGGFDRQEIKPSDIDAFIDKCREALLDLVKNDKL